MLITRSRRVETNEVVLDQADLFQSNGFDRVAGLAYTQVGAQIFWNNQPQPWALVDGLVVTNKLITSGNIYWNEIPGAPGFYNVRWRPLGVGYWRLVLTYAGATAQTIMVDYDVFPQSDTTSETGLVASFLKP